MRQKNCFVATHAEAKVRSQEIQFEGVRKTGFLEPWRLPHLVYTSDGIKVWKTIKAFFKPDIDQRIASEGLLNILILFLDELTTVWP